MAAAAFTSCFREALGASSRAAAVMFWCPSQFVLLLQFKDHLKKAEAVSEFAKSKTIAEQRRFLPVYGVREEMLQVRPQAGCAACVL